MASKDKFDDLNLSSDEVKRIGEALKNEEFRKLFVEYAEEISNPENKKKYEEEIAQMENERGMDVQFVHPEPGHCIKTSVDGNTKAFINICMNNKIEGPNSTPQVDSNGRRGLHWQIPHSFAPPRDDIVKSGGKCKVFDVVFHPDTYRMGENPRFMKLVEDTAVEGIEKQFGVKIDRKNLKTMKMKYKGVPVATVIRTRSDKLPEKSPNEEHDNVLKDIPYPYDNKTSAEKSEEMRESVKNKKNVEAQKAKSKFSPKKDCPAEPKYSITHRSNVDLQEYRNVPDAKTSTRPNELEIIIELPLLDSAKQVELDVFEKKLSLSSEKPAEYKLDMSLPYPVDEEQGSARFDKNKHCLIVTLPVLPPEQLELPFSGTKNEGPQEEQTSQNHGEEQPKLIEEIPPPEDLPDLEEIDTEVEVSTPQVKEAENPNPPPAPKIAYGFPDFTFSQDTEVVAFVLNVWNVSPDTVSITYTSPSSCQVQFVSLGSGGFPIYYRFIVVFETDCNIVPEHCTTDVNDANVVFTILKEKKARTDWEKFYAGCSNEQLQEFLFVTEKNLQTELDQLTAEPENEREESENTPSVVVTEMNKKKLAIKIKKNKQHHVNANQSSSSGSRTITPLTDSEEEELASVDNGPPSAEIKVVHDLEVPNLHGILKQRSVSESSEDLTSSNSSCSPSSPREDLFGFKKSVKFNDRIDQTTFRSGAAVTSMTTALKSKRRRNRKREEKKNGRQRLNSGGSEGTSSGEELESRQAVEEEEEILENDQQEEENEESVENFDDIEKFEGLNEHVEKKEMGSGDEIGPNVIGTSCVASESVESKLVKSIKQKLSVAEPDQGDDSDDDGGENQEGNLSDKKEKEVHVIIKDKALDYRTKPTNPGDSNQSNGTEQLDKSSIMSAKQSGEDSGVESGLEGPGDSSEKPEGTVETSLSWEEHGKSDPVSSSKTQPPGTTDLTNMDHRTQCAFAFSNAIMFDLDVD